MGFDLYGISPVMRAAPPDRPDDLYEGDTPEDVQVRHAYLDAKMEFEDSNPGIYFRRSVWGWRPLWECVYRFTDALTEDDYHSGCYNDGHLIPRDVAVQIATDLTAALEAGKITSYLKERAERVKAIPDRTCERCDGSGHESPRLEVLEGKAMQSLFRLVPEPCLSCRGAGTHPSFDSMYSMEERCVEEFRTFCEESGGFSIC